MSQLLSLDVGGTYEISENDVYRHLEIGGQRWSTARRSVQADSPAQAWWKSFLRFGPTGGDSVTRPPVTAVDLFSGAGGLTLAASEAVSSFGRALQSLAAADLDGRALEVYRANNPGAELLGGSIWKMVDFGLAARGSNARFNRLPRLRNPVLQALKGRVDLLLAGPPCQGHSSLNNSTRGDDARNVLYDAAVAIAIALGVRTVVIENVPGVVRDRYQVVSTAGALLAAAGYEVQSGAIRADRLGWPQRRERHFLLASADGIPLRPKDVERGLSNGEANVDWVFELPGAPFEAEVMSAPPQLSPENQRRIAYLHENGLFDLPLAERPECHQAGTTYRAAYGRIRPGGPAGTLTTGFMTPGRGRFVHPYEPRALTPREGARLQGFPDTYRFVSDEARLPSRQELAKWIGDAVPTPLGSAAVIGALAPIATKEWKV